MPAPELPTKAPPAEETPSKPSVSVCSAEMSTDVERFPVADPSLPIIPGYRVLGQLGAGGMGQVYEVIDEKIGVRLALKMIHPMLADATFLARFRQEIRAMMDLDHPHIARIYGHGETGDCPFFTMRLLAGGSLASRKEELQADPRRAVELMVKVCDAVGYLHARGKVHRDLKLSNILLDEHGEPFVSDFGLVKEWESTATPSAPVVRTDAESGHAAADTSTRDEESDTPHPPRIPPSNDPLTRTGKVLGTYAYMSPEQTRGEKYNVGPPSDVWALGVILYELLAGCRPFQAREPDELFQRICEESPAPPTAARDQQEPELDAIVLQCLAKNAAERCESVAVLTDVLRKWLGGPETVGEPKKPTVRWGRWLLAATTVICLALLGIASFSWPKVTPERRLQQAQDQLAAGKPVTWIGEKGEPLWYRTRAGAEAAFTRQVWDETFTVDSHTWALVEICPDPKCDRYRIEADVRQNSMRTADSRAGIYLFHQTHDPEQRGHSFGHWFFTEDLPEHARWQDPPAGMRAGRAEFHLSYFEWQPPVPVRPSKSSGGRTADFTSSQDAAEKGIWRQMAVDVSPDEVVVWFDGKKIDTYKRDRLEKFAKGLEIPGNETPRLSPRGGIGLFISASSASFRRVVVRPVLAEQQ